MRKEWFSFNLVLTKNSTKTKKKKRFCKNKNNDNYKTKNEHRTAFSTKEKEGLQDERQTSGAMGKERKERKTQKLQTLCFSPKFLSLRFLTLRCSSLVDRLLSPLRSSVVRVLVGSRWFSSTLFFFLLSLLADFLVKSVARKSS
jgi:hypothetical protein